MHYLMKLFFSLSLFFVGINGAVGSNQPSQANKNPKLFVFGNSYADTGNMKPTALSWKPPYGITFPGKPSGRYSDGLTATDFLAKQLGAKLPYLWRTHGKKKVKLNRGMNFAFGGSEVFDSPVDRSPNISTQVGFLVNLALARRVYTIDGDLASSYALLSYSGTDYYGFIDQNPNMAAYPAFVEFIVEDIQYSLGIMNGLKFKNIAVTSLHPLGCLPRVTVASSFRSCNESYSDLVRLHNESLKKAVAKLNKEDKFRTKGDRFVIVDLHKAFMTILEKKGNKRFKSPLKPCCEGDCARMDMKGAKKYTLCNDPKSAFFWDEINPTQEGWRSIYSLLGKSLTESLTKG
ncbi:GDSL esterase/lipase [Arabidopsis thaliana]|uniref:GDSL esterase/lipase n=3 Tax=Arabidopsis TaxID=3701 RepID=A0A178UNK2_ARATH|nr:hypothetical protein AXX17_AT5G02890 [Arabidopsis thaliana]